MSKCRRYTLRVRLVVAIICVIALLKFYTAHLSEPAWCGTVAAARSPRGGGTAAARAAIAKHRAAGPLPTTGAGPRPPICATRAGVVKTLQRLVRHVDARRADCACVGPRDGLVCDRTRFWLPPLIAEPVHLAPALANKLADAEDEAAKTPATPWLEIGSLKFTANEYLDFLVFHVFFSDPAWVGHGTFLETGGSNGVHASNSFFFERSLNWTGVLIEPTPCAVCEIPLNRRATSVHAALGTRGGPATLDVSSMEQFCPNCPETLPWSPVRTGRLQELSAAAGFENVDFLSLDVEGFGETVLADITWGSSFAPSVVVVECLNDLAFCVHTLEGAGYTAVLANTALSGAGTESDVIAWRNDVRCNF